MNIYRKEWMVWAIIALLVLNLSTWATIYWHTRSGGVTDKQGGQSGMAENTSIRYSGRYFRDELNLDASQMSEFIAFNPLFRQNVRQINQEMARLKHQMLEELSGPECDTLKLNELSDSIGLCHALLKKETYRYYVSIKTICTPDQQQKLKLIFSDIFDLTVQPGHYGNGAGKGYGHGRRSGI